MNQYTEKKGIIKRVGPKKTSFPNGSPVTIKFKQNGVDKTVAGVSVGVQFDFDPDVWYSGILFEKQAEALAEGKSVDVKVWEKESNGKVYKNFAIVSPKKADTAKLEEEINILKTTVHRQGQQIMSMYAQIQKLEQFLSKKETTTMFDDDAKDVHPDEYNALYGVENADAQNEYEQYDDPSQIPF